MQLIRPKSSQIQQPLDTIEISQISIESNIDKQNQKKTQAQQNLKINQYFVVEHNFSIEKIQSEFKTQINLEDIEQSVGLTEEEAQKRLEEYGPNVISPPPDIPEWKKFLHHLFDLLNVLLIIAGGLSFLAFGLHPADQNNAILGGVLLFFVLFSSVMGYLQEKSTSDVMGKFTNMLPPLCYVIRNKNIKQIKARELVKGDLVKLQSGDKIPADVRIVYNRGLTVEQSSCTGEQEPIEMSVEAKSEEYLEAKNIGFNSCLCLEGGAYGVVIKTGDETFIGTIARSTSKPKSGETSLQKEIRLFVLFITKLALIMATSFFIIGIARGKDPLYCFINGFIIIIVANVPQGLPSTVQSVLTLVADNLGQQNIFVKKVQTLETLGSATVIASDKTGTLTTNCMTVKNMWCDLESISADDVLEDHSTYLNKKSFKKLIKIAVLCNKAAFQDQVIINNGKTQLEILEEKGVDLLSLQPHEMRALGSEQLLSIRHQSSKNMRTLDSQQIRAVSKQKLEELKKKNQELRNKINQDQNSQLEFESMKILARKKSSATSKLNYKDVQNRPIAGDASESALLRFCESLTDTNIYRQENKKIFEIPFNSKNKWQLSIHEYKSHRTLVMKGAPEMVILRCSRYLKNGEILPITDEFKSKYLENYRNYGKQGQRVLGFATQDLDDSSVKEYKLELNNFPTENLVFVGLMSMEDPPKQGVKEAIITCKKAGLKVFMITGDHPLTAESIARSICLIDKCKTKEQIALEKGIDPSQVPHQEADAAVIYGPDLNNFSIEDWNNLFFFKKEIVFARISPQQKVDIVHHLQRLKEVVAVTGDGVNDAIALKDSDIGISMGITGSDVAKDAADVIFMDDDFTNIVLGINEGRRLFDNLRKSAAYILSHLIPEAIPILMNLALGIPLALNALLILSIDMGTEMMPAISFAKEQSEQGIMERKPRDSQKDRLVDTRIIIYSYLIAGFVETAACLIAFFWQFSLYGIDSSQLFDASETYFTEGCPNLIASNGVSYTDSQQITILQRAQTAYYITLVLSQLMNLFICRTRVASLFTHGFGNRSANIGCLVSLSIMVLVVYCPGLQDVIFMTQNLDDVTYTSFLISSFLLLSYAEFRKFKTRQDENSWIAKYLNW